jgi:5'(3')-deoxyribonucleotidase
MIDKAGIRDHEKVTRKRIAIDMDEVIADTLQKFLSVCNTELGLKFTKSDLTGRNLWEVIGKENFPALRGLVSEHDFFADLDVMPDSQEVIRGLMERYEVFISSAAMEVPTSFTAKFDWLKRHFPFIPASHIVFCGDKSILNADYLIDDNSRHFERFSGEGILYTAPHNSRIEGYRRVDNWKAVEEIFR